MLALASCRELPPHERDDAALHAALRALGASFRIVAWDDVTVDWGVFDACLIRTTWDWHERPGAFRAWIDRVARETRLVNAPELVRWNLDKRYLRELERGGVPVIPTRWIEAAGDVDLEAELGAFATPRAFLKPVFGANASATLRFERDDAGLAAARAHLARHPGPFMLQPFLESVADAGEVSAIFVDGRCTHAVRKVPKAGDYRVQDDWGATDAAIEPDAALLAASTRALDLCPVPPLYARADFLADADGGLLLTELELTEPSLFFRHGPEAAHALARAVLREATPS